MKIAHTTVQNILDNLRKVIYGKDEQLKSVLSAWLSGGHVLIEDVPGTGKTMLVKALAKLTDVKFGRVQFTPDLLPTDILGTSVYSEESHNFDFHQGPIFSTCFLGDEINRATPRTQSALLECMAERQVTFERKTYQLDPLFVVIATQNPIEQHGTFPLPEAQLDRFCIKISMGYPRESDEIKLMQVSDKDKMLSNISTIVERKDLMRAKMAVPHIKVNESIYKYVIRIIKKLRMSNDLLLGSSPRASMDLIQMAKAMAFIEGLTYVRPTHVFHLAVPVIAHRLALTPEAKFANKTTVEVVTEVLNKVKVPTD